MVKKSETTLQVFADLEPEQALLAHIILQSVIDAQQTKEPDIQAEAWDWLWECVPHIAEGMVSNRLVEFS